MIYHPNFNLCILYNISKHNMEMKMKTINDAVVERLYKYMEEKNITQYKLAQLSGVPFPTIKSIMQRKTNNITLKTLMMLSDGLGIKLIDFLNDPLFDSKNLDLE